MPKPDKIELTEELLDKWSHNSERCRILIDALRAALAKGEKV